MTPDLTVRGHICHKRISVLLLSIDETEDDVKNQEQQRVYESGSRGRNRQLGLRTVKAEVDELEIKALREEHAEEQKEECRAAVPDGGAGFLSKEAPESGEDGSKSGKRQNHVRERNVIARCKGCLLKAEHDEKHSECRKDGTKHNGESLFVHEKPHSLISREESVLFLCVEGIGAGLAQKPAVVIDADRQGIPVVKRHTGQE